MKVFIFLPSESVDCCWLVLPLALASVLTAGELQMPRPYLFPRGQSLCSNCWKWRRGEGTSLPPVPQAGTSSTLPMQLHHMHFNLSLWTSCSFLAALRGLHPGAISNKLLASKPVSESISREPDSQHTPWDFNLIQIIPLFPPLFWCWKNAFFFDCSSA